MIPLLVVAGAMSAGSVISGAIGASQARKQQQEASAKVENYLNEIRNLSRDQLAQVMQAKEAWEQTFGSIRDNLVNYYQNLNPNSEGARRVQILEQNYSTMSDRLNSELASRGLATSGIATQANTALLADLASKRADAQYSVKGDIAKTQSEFYRGIAMPEQRALDYKEMQATQNLARAGYAGMDYFQQQANRSEASANAGMQQVGQALGGLAQTIGAGFMANELGLLGNSTPQPSTTLGYSQLPNSSDAYFVAPLQQQASSASIYQQDPFLKKFIK